MLRRALHKVYSNDLYRIAYSVDTIAIPDTMQLPSLDALHGFLAAAQALNFRRAAKMVAVTPAALGQRIRGLEELCGAPLFLRTTRAVELTEAGRRMIPVAQRTLAAAAECLNISRDGTAPAPIDVVMGTRADLGHSWLVPQTRVLSEKMPWLTLHLYFGSGSDLLARLRTREIDCAITSTRFIDPQLESFPLHREEFVFVATPELLRRTPLTRPEHAVRHTLIDVAPELPLFRAWRDAPGAHHLAFERVLRFGSLAAIHHLLLEHRGVAVLPRYFVTTSLAQRRLRKVFPRVRPTHDTFRLLYRGNDFSRIRSYRILAAHLLEQPLV